MWWIGSVLWIKIADQSEAPKSEHYLRIGAGASARAYVTTLILVNIRFVKILFIYSFQWVIIGDTQPLTGVELLISSSFILTV